jgi:hypothetical protein
MIGEGFDLLWEDKDQLRGCDILLEAWDEIKAVMDTDNIKDLPALDEMYEWDEYITNYVQDLEMELGNATGKDSRYALKRIKYCEELLERGGDGNKLFIENTRRAIADSHWVLGNQAECDRLYELWLADDATWGWGYIGWSDCYQFKKEATPSDLAKAEDILTKALAQEDLRDRRDVLDRAIDLKVTLGKTQEAAKLQDVATRIKKSQKLVTPKVKKTNLPVRSTKIGRNVPCPCGSGKKYKKCCGK